MKLQEKIQELAENIDALITDYIEAYKVSDAHKVHYTIYCNTCIKYLKEGMKLFEKFPPFDEGSELMKEYLYLQYLRDIICDTMKDSKYLQPYLNKHDPVKYEPEALDNAIDNYITTIKKEIN